jgi:DNA repair protein RadA/Sms
MSPRTRRDTAYACASCDYRTSQWLGRCPQCGSWATLEEREEPLPARSPGAPPAREAARPLAYPTIPVAPTRCTSTGTPELDRVLGGGLVPGAAILLGGEPGIGKSTLLLQAASALAETGVEVLYVSGEESAAQLRLRGDRLGVRSDRLRVLADTDVGNVVERTVERLPGLLVVDSIQAVRCPDLASLPGSVSQVRESASRLVDLAKQRAVPLVLVGHVTKDGALAGPRVLEHLVDTVIHFEGDRHHAHRMLRAVKNRFGPADELGVFRMTERGLEEVASPSELLLAERTRGTPGSVVLAANEGTRPLLVEIQALVGEPGPGSPRRTVLGVDPNRVALVLAVLQRRTGLASADRDVFVNVTGGVTVAEPAADLAVAAALVSSLKQRPVPDGWVVAGEIGLTGEVRAVSRADARLREAARLGFAGAVIPAASTPRSTASELKVLPIRQLGDALSWMFPDSA